MGLEERCSITWQGQARQAAVHLDSTALEVRGRPRLVIPLTSIRRVQVVGGQVQLDTPDGMLTLALGGAAEAWARKIAAPPSRAKKLGVAAGTRVSLLGLDAPDFEAEISAAGAERIGPRGKADLVFLRVDALDDLARLHALTARIEPGGALWVVRLKGKLAPVKEGDVREAAHAAGLVDVKVAAFSDTLTADKYVIPVANRTSPAKQGAPRALARAAPAASRKKAGKTGARR